MTRRADTESAAIASPDSFRNRPAGKEGTKTGKHALFGPQTLEAVAVNYADCLRALKSR
jgi:hypothetical protein